MPAAAIHGPPIQTETLSDHRSRIRSQTHQRARAKHQTADLGHRTIIAYKV